MTQLDMFAAAPAPTRRPVRPDTAMLLAMSADHIMAPATPGTTPRPNANGVYQEQNETLSLPRPVKGWQGGNLADIEIIDLGPYWLWATSYQLHGGDMRGSAQPLKDVPWCRAPSRAAAIDAAAEHLRSRLEGLDNVDARRVLAWLNELDQDGFL